MLTLTTMLSVTRLYQGLREFEKTSLPPAAPTQDSHTLRGQLHPHFLLFSHSTVWDSAGKTEACHSTHFVVHSQVGLFAQILDGHSMSSGGSERKKTDTAKELV